MNKSESPDVPPEWLNNSFFEKALKNEFSPKDLKVFQAEVKAATVPGDNYASRIFRCKLTVKIGRDEAKENAKTMSVLVKIISSGVLGEALKKFLAFEKESEMLSKTVPALTSILRKAYPEQPNMGAACYYFQGPPNHLIVMEDLKVNNFQTASRFEGLDLNHSTLVLESLGKFHAASLLLKENDPNALKSFTNSIWSGSNSDMMKQFLCTTIKFISEDIVTWKNYEKTEHYSQKFRNLGTDVVERILNLMKINDDKLNVLLHGDSWVNNFMFRYDSSGNPVEVKFVDFQISFINSPAIDLQYFIFSSTNPRLRFTHIDTFLRIYYNSFEETLKRLNYKLKTPYGLDQLKKDFEEKYFWGLIVFITIFPHFLAPSNETLEPDELIKADKNKLQIIFQREELRKILMKGFNFFEEKGIF